MKRFYTLLRSLYGRGMRHPRKSLAALGVLAVATVVILAGGGAAEAPLVDEQSVSVVTLQSIAALSESTEPIVVVGEVRSVAQAELRFNRGGQVTGVYVQPGQYVQAGAVLAEVENAQERAAVLSAEGTLAAAEAQLAKVRAGARAEDRASVSAQTSGSATALAAAQTGAENAYTSAYTAAYAAVYSQADTFFKDSYTVRPTFTVNTATYDERMVLEKERVALVGVLEAWEKDTQVPLTADILDTKLAEAQDTLVRVKAFITSIGAYVSEQEVNEYLSASEKAAQEGTVSIAQQSLDVAKASVTGARSALAQTQTSAQVAQENERALTAGARPEDIAAAEAGVMQARGARASALASLADTRITTPIPGTVTSIQIDRGDFVQPSQQAATIAGNGGLSVEMFVSEDIKDRIQSGQMVLLADGTEGTVMSIEPGVDPVTKRSRVLIALSKSSALTVGAFVQVTVPGLATPTSQATVVETGTFVPVSALKVLPSGLVVFSVSDEQTLVAHPVKEGVIVGDRMRLATTLPADLQIVTDARGLNEGERVTVSRDK